MQTVDVPGLDQVAQRVVGVDLALDPAGGAERDERARVELQLVAARRKNSSSFGLAPGQPASM